MSRRRIVEAVFAFALALPGMASAAHARPGAEAELLEVIDSVVHGRAQAALKEADRLVAQYPNFRLAQLVRGDLLLAQAQRIDAFGAGVRAAPERLEGLRAEAAARLRAAKESPAADSVPIYLLELPPHGHAVVVDAALSRVFVYASDGGIPRLVTSFYSSLGKRGTEKERQGDQKTPIGVYRITSSIPGRKLPDLYGWGAFPLDYPNEWDRLQGRTGYGIWIHGVPSDTYARAPQASDGCIALANPDLEELARFVAPGSTPVVVARRADWLTPQSWRAEREAFLRELEAWRADWESGDTGRYLAHYASGFRSDGMGLERWRAYKRRVNAAKSWIKVSLANVSVLRDPGPQPLMVVTFDQDYRSSNHAQKARKRQYWMQENGAWKIAYEAPLGRPVLSLPESYPGKGRS